MDAQQGYLDSIGPALQARVSASTAAQLQMAAAIAAADEAFQNGLASAGDLLELHYAQQLAGVTDQASLALGNNVSDTTYWGYNEPDHWNYDGPVLPEGSPADGGYGPDGTSLPGGGGSTVPVDSGLTSTPGTGLTDRPEQADGKFAPADTDGIDELRQEDPKSMEENLANVKDGAGHAASRAACHSVLAGGRCRSRLCRHEHRSGTGD